MEHSHNKKYEPRTKETRAFIFIFILATEGLSGLVAEEDLEVELEELEDEEDLDEVDEIFEVEEELEVDDEFVEEVLGLEEKKSNRRLRLPSGGADWPEHSWSSGARCLTSKRATVISMLKHIR